MYLKYSLVANADLGGIVSHTSQCFTALRARTYPFKVLLQILEIQVSGTVLEEHLPSAERTHFGLDKVVERRACGIAADAEKVDIVAQLSFLILFEPTWRLCTQDCGSPTRPFVSVPWSGLKERLQSTECHGFDSFRKDQRTQDGLAAIEHSLQTFNSFRMNVGLLATLDRAVSDISRNINWDSGDYISCLNEDNDDPLLPPLKVAGTLCPYRRRGIENLRHLRKQAIAMVLEWQRPTPLSKRLMYNIEEYELHRRMWNRRP